MGNIYTNEKVLLQIYVEIRISFLKKINFLQLTFK